MDDMPAKKKVRQKIKTLVKPLKIFNLFTKLHKVSYNSMETKNLGKLIFFTQQSQKPINCHFEEKIKLWKK